MIKTPGDYILYSAERLHRAEINYLLTGDPLYRQYLKVESRILLRRVFKFWLRIHLNQRKEVRKAHENSRH